MQGYLATASGDTPVMARRSSVGSFHSAGSSESPAVQPSTGGNTLGAQSIFVAISETYYNEFVSISCQNEAPKCLEFKLVSMLRCFFLWL